MLEAATPVVLICALALAGALLRDRRRRRRQLNAALHELRRPLQLLVLGLERSAGDPACDADRIGQVREATEMLCAAATQLDAEINGAGPPETDPAVAIGTAAEVLRRAATRWSVIPGVEVILPPDGPGSAQVLPGGRRIDQALDNLIANGLDHGTGPVRVSLDAASEVAFAVDNRVAAGGSILSGHPHGAGMTGPGRHRDPRRGHGLGVARALAETADGRVDAEIRSRKARFSLRAGSGTEPVH